MYTNPRALRVEGERAADGLAGHHERGLRALPAELAQQARVGRPLEDGIGEGADDDARVMHGRVVQGVHARHVAVDAADAAAL
jgi:hypothetical protein